MKSSFDAHPSSSALLGLTIFFAGCMSYPVQVDTRREARTTVPAGRTYYVDVAVSNPLARDRHFAPAMICLRTAMMHRGFVEVMRPEQAALTLEFAYGIAPAGVEQSYRAVDGHVEPREVVSLTTGQVRQIMPRSPIGVETNIDPRYTVWVQIIAHDAATKKEIWSVLSQAVIGAADHNNILPCLIAAAEPNLEPGASAKLVAHIDQNATEVVALRSGR